MKIIKNDIYRKMDEALDFYGINEKYKKMCYDCVEGIKNSSIYIKVFDNVYKKLYYNDFSEIRELWEEKDINKLFAKNVNPFITNIMILLGYEFHIYNIKQYNLDENQIRIHKKRVKECFENDIEIRGYKGIRISQMLWAIYFIRLRIIEIGRLQYQYSVTEDNKQIIKIHIPRGEKLDITSVKESIKKSKQPIEKIFKLSNCEYICDSWLLSNQVHELIDKDTNIYKFQQLFDVEDGKNCINDILNFVFNIDEIKDYKLLEENTKLQRIIKQELLNNRDFYKGLGTLKKFE